ncbi:transmembrane and death domain protein 1-like isoform X1 [Hemiscyllium ocellatum]|uniref:transmembrane and death domain protein 1-like isoform X1 n=1 Tax=Hemiscyllium ocellatum TaxID=170820 RepID=UPI0029660E02|nr:transmembrane and death domain protein 1-like isoform X1 [Hemiscyllium ocellatum]XP_060701092.1 transmembrane and death domain protein 1-like isoform X1 [Hemiscyllium ocellatum]XP_060701093.1 transmembrane and death domain protein 1-like isoform X1 [Hemiscyllium ocellatum]
MIRISELLTSVECDLLHKKLTHPEKDIMKDIDQMSEENDNLFKTRKRREITNTEDCTEILIDWLRNEGDSMYWDRLSRALRQIGREDVDKELRKNMNQDKTLEMNKNVEEYGKILKQAHSSLIVTDDEINIGDRNRDKRSEFLEINWDELELIVEMEKLPPYPRKLTEGFRTVLWGVFFGFVGSTFLGAISLYFIMKITEKDYMEIVRRSNVLHRIKRRRKPVRRIVYSSDDENTHEDKSPKHFRQCFLPFRTTNYAPEKLKPNRSTN